MKKHDESAFETSIKAYLLEHSYQQRHSSDYDRETALLTPDFIGFIQDTQPETWAKLRQLDGAKLEERLIGAFSKMATSHSRGVLGLIREGFKYSGQTIRLAYFRPAHGLNPDVLERYEKNRLTVVRQLKYDPNNENSIDLVLFLNGIPVVTAELKNPMTGQTITHARNQYRKDRDPAAPIFRFRERALVHFAVDPDEVEMTTKLAGKGTFFLPFNKGYRNGAGNPPVPGKHRTHYLWEEVWERHSLLEIVGRFIQLKTEEERTPRGRIRQKKTMIFPRYHQLDCVRKLVTASRENGPGKNYLIQHSTGSGKSMSIAWLTHRLSSLHDDEDNKIYDSVIVITDRRVLDSQLQDTIYQVDHRKGVVEKIDEDSTQLAEALAMGKPVIITTLHKFPFVSEKIGELPDRNYAVVVDEAHSSQSGEMAAEMKAILSKVELPERVKEDFPEDAASADIYEAAYRAALYRGPRHNLSFFAFTATPKAKTLEMFGHRDAEGRPDAFHLYSMKQAIEEGFILDVLQNYTTYKTYFGLVKQIEEDPRMDKKKASKALARFLSLHPHNVSQKTEIIVEHFRQNVMSKIGGKAKAMVVTGSRLHAIRYKQAFDRYIRDKGFEDAIRCLVAFSGTVEDPETGATYTEVEMNDGIREKELPGKFATDDYKILLVANKYQTGFDQPLLHTMYVDKRLFGIQAVQTLSRLNRTYPGKDDTFVLDFVNRREDILESFKPYYETTGLEETVDPQKLYEIQHDLDEFHIYTKEEVEAFARVFFSPKFKKSDHGRLESYINPACDRFKEREEAEQEDFRSTLATFLRLYSFVAQIIQFTDAELEMLYAFGRMLSRKLPKRGSEAEDVDLSEDVALKYYRIQKMQEGEIALEGGGTVSGPREVGTGGRKEEEEVELSRLIDMLNDRFGTEFTEEDQLFFDQIEESLVHDEELRASANANSKDTFLKHVAPDKLEEAFLSRHEKNADIVEKIYGDKDFRAVVLELLGERLYEGFREEAQ